MQSNILYIQCKEGLPINSDMLVAAQGFEHLGYEVRVFEFNIDKFIFRTSSLEQYIFVGGIDCMRHIFRTLNKLPLPINFPIENGSAGLIGRELKYLTLQEALDSLKAAETPFFIKPVERKLFDAILLSKQHQLSYFRDFKPDIRVIVSEPLEIISEWRTFVHLQQMIDCRNYIGDFRVHPDYSVIQANIDVYQNSPVAYTLDVAVLRDGRTVVVEFDDFWSVGAYGLDPADYARMLRDRYIEIITSQQVIG
jgi:ATP-grasp domain, R2K clade family 2